MSMQWNITWDVAKRSAWDKAHHQAGGAYQQDWAYGEVMTRAGARVLRAQIKGPAGRTIGLAQIIARPVAMFGRFALCTYGPVWTEDLDQSEKSAAIRSLKRALPMGWPSLLLVTPDGPKAPEGLKRVMTGDATVRINLCQEPEILRKALDGKWRNALVKAEKSDLSFTSAGQKSGQYQWLLDKELIQRAAKGYRGLAPQLTTAWQEEKLSAKTADKKAGLAIFRADLGKEPAAAMLFLTHGKQATYHIGWSSDEGRKLGAHNLILWNAMLELRWRGVECLDLGGVNTQSGAGIARFKLGTGGDVLVRAGSFV